MSTLSRVVGLQAVSSGCCHRTNFPRSLALACTVLALSLLSPSRMAAQAGDQRGLKLSSEVVPTETAGGAYYALVVGIDRYKPPLRQLRTAVNDAQAIAKILRERYGFQVTLLLDDRATRASILDILYKDRGKLRENDNLLIYFAGHGHLDKDADKTYWLPADADSESNSNWISADDLNNDVRAQPARHILIISDSCFSGGLTRDPGIEARPVDQQALLRRMLASKSRTVMASGGLEPVADSGADGHSVFANIVLRALNGIDEETFTAEHLFSVYVRSQVAGKSEQVPEYAHLRNSNDDAGDFVFSRGGIARLAQIDPSKENGSALANGIPGKSNQPSGNGDTGSAAAVVQPTQPMKMTSLQGTVTFQPQAAPSCQATIRITPNPDNKTYTATLPPSGIFHDGVASEDGKTYTFRTLEPNAVVMCNGGLYRDSSGTLIVKIDPDQGSPEGTTQKGSISGQLEVNLWKPPGTPTVTFSGEISGTYVAQLVPDTRAASNPSGSIQPEQTSVAPTPNVSPSTASTTASPVETAETPDQFIRMARVHVIPTIGAFHHIQPLLMLYFSSATVSSHFVDSALSIVFRKGSDAWRVDATSKEVVGAMEKWQLSLKEVGEQAAVCFSARDEASGKRRVWMQRYNVAPSPMGKGMVDFSEAGEPSLKLTDGEPCDGVTKVRK